MATTWSRPITLDRPLWRCATAWPAGPVALLDSAMDPGRLGRWSFLAAEPAAQVTARRLGPGAPGEPAPFELELTAWRSPDGTRHGSPAVRRWTGNPFNSLRNIQLDYAADGGPALPGLPPFQGGLVGWLGYGAAHALEHLPSAAREDQDLPDVAFLVADAVLAQDHATGQAWLSVTGRGADPAADAEATFARWQDRLAAPAPAPADPGPARSVAVRSRWDRAAYAAAVERCRAHILAGDVFEVCLTQRLEADLPCPPWRLYEVLRAGNPAPFAAWLDLAGVQVVGASPERFLRLDRDGRAESRPIKGTRPRGADARADAALCAELAASDKDRAENVMIVDLVRNDLGRVCVPGSVTVPELLAVETYATVHQLVSTVQGRLRPGCDAVDLVKAAFPGGSMTGAPKIAAMAIIDGLEPLARGIYSGAVGYFDRGGGMDLSIVIRTIVCRDGRATFGVGGAVTADSDPGAEHDEAMAKAKALIRALGSP
ncbi:MAG TPA: aminodeoxychorismate synthase component I [Candidatus Krumholzibacteria bacterium]|nr:aminodeoxychorismate synthase component I [Candidatus Krumholzibacteria bacterium]